MPEALTGKLISSIRDISIDQVRDAIRELFTHYYN
jgi:hypothetical protein